jgi:hypothetical protein
LSIHPCGTSRVLLHAVKLTTWELPALLPIREESVLRIFIALKYPSPWPGFKPATFASSGQHTNHYTTKATPCSINSVQAIKHECPRCKTGVQFVRGRFSRRHVWKQCSVTFRERSGRWHTSVCTSATDFSLHWTGFSFR